ncbi:MAG: CopD family protein [Candidatus Hydrothermarchaeales archaeon]
MVASILTVLLIWLHIVAVAVWIGGAVFMIYIFSPNLALLQPPDAGKVGGAVGKKFTSVVWGAVAVTAITGLLRMYSAGLLDVNRLTGTSYGITLLLKIILFVVMLGLGGMIGKTEKVLATATSPAEAVAAQKKMALLGKLVIGLGIVLIFVGIGLNYGIF